MNTIIYFENEAAAFQYNTRILREIRRHYPQEPITVISAGDFSSAGSLLVPSCKERSAGLIEAGADLVLSLPAASVLGGYGKKEFAGTALIQKLHASEKVVIPCIPAPEQSPEDCGKALRAFAMLMFRADSDYCRRQKEYAGMKLTYRDAQARAVCDCFPEADLLLSFPENRYALWLLDTMLELYYIPAAEFLDVSSLYNTEEPISENDAEKTSRFRCQYETKAAAKAAALFDTCSPETLIEIAGSTPQMVTDFFEKRQSIQIAGSLEQIVQLIQFDSSERVRLFLLKSILGIRQIHMQICGLHEYAPYCYVSAENAQKKEFLCQIENWSWVPFVKDPSSEQKVRENYRYLMQADRNVGELIN